MQASTAGKLKSRRRRSPRGGGPMEMAMLQSWRCTSLPKALFCNLRNRSLDQDRAMQTSTQAHTGTHVNHPRVTRRQTMRYHSRCHSTTSKGPLPSVMEYASTTPWPWTHSTPIDIHTVTTFPDSSAWCRRCSILFSLSLSPPSLPPPLHAPVAHFERAHRVSPSSPSSPWPSSSLPCPGPRPAPCARPCSPSPPASRCPASPPPSPPPLPPARRPS